MGDFYADDDVGALPDFRGGRLGVHVVDVLFDISLHALANDIEEREDPDFGFFDYVVVELVESPPARATAIDHGGYAVWEAHFFGEHGS